MRGTNGLIRKPPGHSGFTLLEVLLALALSVLVLGALAFAIQVTLRATHSGRADVARAQLARAVLRRISDDLRSAVWHEPLEIDLSAVSASGQGGSSGGQSPAGSGGDGDGDDSSGNGPGGSGGQPSGLGSGGSAGNASGGGPASSGGSTSGSTGTSAGDTETSSLSAPMPGLHGGLDWIEVDVSRLPRVDQYEQSISATDASPLELASDVKTVAYYMAGSQATAANAGATGLMRRQLDRAVTQWAAMNGNLLGLDQAAQALAPEVVSIQFEYFDGYEWLTEWDSDASQGLPMAVEIAIALDSQADPSQIDPEENTYRLVVHLPSARPSDGSVESGGSSSGSDSQSGASSSSSSSGSSRGQP
ncbi:MAG: prepilin-type N-terminal cleavage/methylation domain-containing protein [Pirellulales bacterium]